MGKQGMTNGEKIQEILNIDRDCTKVHGENGTMTFEVTQEWWESEYKEPTTKNDLAVDTISRADARSLICNTDIKHHMSGMSRKVFKDLYNGMDELPTVTPQEPRKGHWIEEFVDTEGEVRFTCSCCGKYQLFGTDFCYNCGAKMEEVEE